MEIIYGLENITSRVPCALTMGTFDGVHLGHLQIIKQLREEADRQNLCATLITFEPHPRLVVKRSGSSGIRILTTLQEKIALLKEQPLDRVVVVKFDEAFSRIEYEEFVKTVLLDKLGSQALIIGYDHAFGKNREGNFSNLEKISKKYGFTLDKVEPYEVEGQIVSSTFIRQFLNDGDVALAAKLLGRNYAISGTVISGDARGKILHFPTANIETQHTQKLIPKPGVYAVDVHYAGESFKGMMNIGYRPTFQEDGQLSVEVHIINFNKDIYGEQLTISFKKRLRDEIKFKSKDELIAQLQMDREQSLKL